MFYSAVTFFFIGQRNMFSSSLGFYHARDFPFLFTVIPLPSCRVNSVVSFMLGWCCPNLLFSLVQYLTVFENCVFSPSTTV